MAITIGKTKKDKRFIRLHKQSSITENCNIIVDTNTGVNYLFVSSGYSGGVTPLLDANGKVIVTPVAKKYDMD